MEEAGRRGNRRRQTMVMAVATMMATMMATAAEGCSTCTIYIATELHTCQWHEDALTAPRMGTRLILRAPCPTKPLPVQHSINVVVLILLIKLRVLCAWICDDYISCDGVRCAMCVVHDVILRYRHHCTMMCS